MFKPKGYEIDHVLEVTMFFQNAQRQITPIDVPITLIDVVKLLGYVLRLVPLDQLCQVHLNL